jgi:hypothetical protein
LKKAPAKSKKKSNSVVEIEENGMEDVDLEGLELGSDGERGSEDKETKRILWTIDAGEDVLDSILGIFIYFFIHPIITINCHF